MTMDLKKALKFNVMFFFSSSQYLFKTRNPITELLSKSLLCKMGNNFKSTFSGCTITLLQILIYYSQVLCCTANPQFSTMNISLLDQLQNNLFYLLFCAALWEESLHETNKYTNVNETNRYKVFTHLEL